MNYTEARELLKYNGVRNVMAVTESPSGKIMRLKVYGDGIMMEVKIGKIKKLLPDFMVQQADQEYVFIEKVLSQ